LHCDAGNYQVFAGGVEVNEHFKDVAVALSRPVAELKFVGNSG